MPDFFDFSNPSGVTAPSLDEPGWGGDMIGGQQPIAPESYDIFGGMQSQPMPQQQRGSQVPFDALGAMAGIQMPEMPQQDSLGRYGLTDDQRQSASRQSLAEILMGAGQSMFADDPSAVVAAAGRSGGIQRAALDQYSTANANAFKMKVDAEAKKLDMISKMSDIQRQSYVIEAEKMKLDELHDQKAVAVEFGNEMAPVMADLLKKTAMMYPDKVGVVKAKLLVAKEKLASGDLAGADIAFENAKMELPTEWHAEMEEQMTRKALEAAGNRDMAFDLASDPNYVAKVKAIGGTIEAGPNGVPTFVSAHELAQRQLETAKINAQIESERAQANYYNQGGSAGRAKALTPAQVMAEDKVITDAAMQIMRPPPDITDANAIARYQEEKATNESRLARIGITAQEWLTLNPDRRAELISNGGMDRPAVAPGSGKGGPIPAASKGLFLRAREGNVVEKKNAINALRNSGDQNMASLIAQVMSKYKKPSNEQEANDTVAKIYADILNQLQPQKR